LQISRSGNGQIKAKANGQKDATKAGKNRKQTKKSKCNRSVAA